MAVPPGPPEEESNDVVLFQRTQLAAKVLDLTTRLRRQDDKIETYQRRVATLEAEPHGTLAQLKDLARETRGFVGRRASLPPSPSSLPSDGPTSLSAVQVDYIRLLIHKLASLPDSSAPDGSALGGAAALRDECARLRQAARENESLLRVSTEKEKQLREELGDAELELSRRRNQLASVRFKRQRIQESNEEKTPGARAPRSVSPERAPEDSKPNGAVRSNAGGTEEYTDEVSKQLASLRSENEELRKLCEFRAKENLRASEECKKHLLDAETARIAAMVKPDLDKIVASPLYHTMEVSLQQLLLKQKEWERQRSILSKERDALKLAKDEEVKALEESLERRVAQLEAQLCDALRAAEGAKSLRDKLSLQYETKKIESGAEERARRADEQLETCRVRVESLTKELSESRKEALSQREELEALRSDVIKNAEEKTKSLIERLRDEVRTERNKSDGFIVEIESLSSLLSETEAQNRKLAQTLAAKEESLTKLNSERLKHKQQVISIKEENKVLLSKKHAEEERAKLIQRSLESTRKQVAEALEALSKAQDESKCITTMAEESRKCADEATQRARAATVERDEARRSREAIVTRLQEATSRLQEQGGHLKKCEEKVMLLETREARQSRRKPGGSSPVADEKDDLLQMYRNKAYCSVETNHMKEVVIRRCGHCFSRKCIDDLIATRNRKCPICHLKFGQDDVLAIYLN